LKIDIVDLEFKDKYAKFFKEWRHSTFNAFYNLWVTPLTEELENEIHR
jgi:hypothetical protein